MPPEFHLDTIEEKAEYDLHQNSPDDPGYRRFLSRLFVPLQARLGESLSGLDFGSGPGPTLSVMLQEAGHQVSIYDPFYAPDTSKLHEVYDFATATEVLEHLRQPQQDLARLWGCVRSGGWLGVMTKLVRDQQAFANWHYKDDPTHICFYSRETFTWLASQWNAELQFVGADVVLLRKAEA